MVVIVLGISLYIIWPHGSRQVCLFNSIRIHFSFFFFFFFFFEYFSFRGFVIWLPILSWINSLYNVHTIYSQLTLFSKSEDSSASSTSDELDVAVVAVFELITISSSFKYGILSHINFAILVFYLFSFHFCVFKLYGIMSMLILHFGTRSPITQQQNFL